MNTKFYAVRKGFEPGIYSNWEDTREQVQGFSGASYKKFSTKKEAEKFMTAENKTRITKKDPDCQLYVDGSYSPKKDQYGWSFVAVVDGKSIFSKYGTGNNEAYIPQRQVGGEVVAVLQGLDYAIYKGFKTVEICYDYDGIEKWITGEWKVKSAIAQAYNYFFELKNQELNILFTKVKAHSDNYFNEMADRLAKKGANG